MFRHVSKIALKYTTSIFSQPQEQRQQQNISDVNSIELVELRKGLDAIFNDQLEEAERIFLTNKDHQPFHAFGYALLTYVKAILSMESDQIDEAIRSIEIATKLLLSPTHSSIHFELLTAHCILLSSSLQFLKDSWIDNLKAAYEIRKAYKLYEHLFEIVLGVPVSAYNNCMNSDASVNVLENGIYFGIGIFCLIFSLLPSKVLNSLGFRLPKSLSIHLLKESCKSKTMYAPLSSLALVYYYVNVCMYLRPETGQLLTAQYIRESLERLKSIYPNNHMWSLLEAKLTKQPSNLQDCLHLLNSPKKTLQPTDQDEGGPIILSLADYSLFRLFALSEVGWIYIFSGDYNRATESFFCLESMSNWSHLFYHFVATCCMIADGLYDKAAREVQQLVHMFEIKKKHNSHSRFSAGEFYAEAKISQWNKYSKTYDMFLRSVLDELIINPLWELVYLWNGVSYWSEPVLNSIKQQLICTIESQDEYKRPFALLLMGVIYRDRLKDVQQAHSYFNCVINEFRNDWTVPYAMYEIAFTYSVSPIERQDKKTLIIDWIKRAENYYVQTKYDPEWRLCMKMKCQLLLELFEE
ncbi:hypothetical protein RMCBS344292_16851 [Rhizopus microsporus]|nr:hypothetical protein RMCBS344292_16851 [Rhizopus microsporus]